jgi:hypothetical protein
MRRILNIVRCIIISPEFLFFLVLFFLHRWFFKYFAILGEKMVQDGEIWKFVPVVPFGMAVISFRLSSSLRAPLDGSNKILYDWPMFSFLVARVYVGMAFSGMFAAGALVLWVLGKEFREDVIGALFVAITGGSCLTYLTMLIGYQNIREILDKNRDAE